MSYNSPIGPSCYLHGGLAGIGSGVVYLVAFVTHLSLAATISQGPQHGVYAEGTVSMELHPRPSVEGFPKGNSSVAVRPFTVRVNGQNWRIRIQNKQSDRIQYTEAGSDGGRLFYYTALQPPPPGSDLVNSGVASIYPDPLPGETGDFVQYVWTAFASQSAFAQVAQDNAIKPLWHVAAHEAPRVRGNVLLSTEAPFLPLHISYYRPAALLPSPFDRGYLGAEFRVNLQTNVSGLTIPLEFDYVQYRPQAVALTAGDLEPQMTVRGKVTWLEANFEDFDPKPALRLTTVVEDYRYEEFDPPAARVQYLVTNTHWPEVRDPIPFSAYRLQVGLPEPHQPRRVLPLLVLTLLLLTPGAIYGSRRAIRNVTATPNT